MQDETAPILFSRFQSDPDAGRQRLSRAARRGSSERIARGAYMSTEAWAALESRARHLARIHAVVATRTSPPVVSHFSAAAVHGLPILGDWPIAVHVTVVPGAGTHSRPTLVKHTARIPPEDLLRVGDLLVTSVARTVLDIAASCTFMDGVIAADAALYSDELHGHSPATTKADLLAAFERALPRRAHARITEVISFAESGAQTPIESVSRVNMRVLRVPRPQLQVAHFDSRGFIGSTDFAWEEFGAVGEADGDRKYLDIAARSGRSPEQVLLDEKNREDRLRALPRKVSRWPWAVAIDPPRLREKLRLLGLPFNVAWESDVS
jgi:hypothetical protein